jgi:hypothetical protein
MFLSAHAASAQPSSLVTGGTAKLLKEGCLLSPNKVYYMCLQGDGNFVLYKGVTALWASNTAGRGTPRDVVIQDDGNLVLYADIGATWASGTGGRTTGWPFTAALHDDGNFVVYASGGRALWASNTGQPGEQWGDNTRHTTNYAVW